ncbi:MAG: peptidoglycan-binding domain-containing protein, partial [Patescibacteria group bacterium]
SKATETTQTTTQSTAQTGTTGSSSGAPNFTSTMQLGSRGDSVTELQKLLVKQGLLDSEPTGYFGKMTEAAVKAYQTKNGISSIGVVGPATRASLNKGL